MKDLPPIFKVNNKVNNNNQKYYKSDDVRDDTIDKVDDSFVDDNNLTINEKLDAIFKTRGYSFNIPVSITFAGKKIDTYLAVRRNDVIITLDNDVIPISTITKLEIKKPS